MPRGRRGGVGKGWGTLSQLRKPLPGQQAAWEGVTADTRGAREDIWGKGWAWQRALCVVMWQRGAADGSRVKGPGEGSITKAELLEGLEIGSRGLGE